MSAFNMLLKSDYFLPLEGALFLDMGSPFGLCLARRLHAGKKKVLPDRAGCQVDSEGLAEGCAEFVLFCFAFLVIVEFHSSSRQDNNASYRLNKKCVPTCTENFIDTGMGSVSTKCCESSLCNISGANSVKISSAVMALGTLASFLYIFRSGL